MTDLIAIDPGSVRGPLTEDRARELVNGIKSHAETMGQMLSELYEGRGWEPLGYSSWRECVKAEFGWSTSHMYRLLNAAEVQETFSPIGGISERVARELVPLPVEQQKVAYTLAQIASGEDHPTARTVKAAVEVIKEAVQTGGYVSVNGMSKGVLAALTETEDELMQRTRQHIIDSQTKKHGERLISVPARYYDAAKADGEYTAVTLLLPDDAYPAFEMALEKSGMRVHVTVYSEIDAIEEATHSI